VLGDFPMIVTLIMLPAIFPLGMPPVSPGLSGLPKYKVALNPVDEGVTVNSWPGYGSM
jgi:hypothetical protein